MQMFAVVSPAAQAGLKSQQKWTHSCVLQGSSLAFPPALSLEVGSGTFFLCSWCRSWWAVCPVGILNILKYCSYIHLPVTCKLSDFCSGKCFLLCLDHSQFTYSGAWNHTTAARREEPPCGFSLARSQNVGFFSFVPLSFLLRLCFQGLWRRNTWFSAEPWALPSPDAASLWHWQSVSALLLSARRSTERWACEDAVAKQWWEGCQNLLFVLHRT